MDVKTLSEKMKVALFDMDGTIFDTMEAWRNCNLYYLGQFGIHPTNEQLPFIFQASSAQILADYIKETFNHEIDWEKFRALQKAEMLKVYDSTPKVKPGAREYIEALRRRGVVTAICTATWTSYTVLGLNRTRMLNLFDAIFTSEIVGFKKGDIRHYEYIADFLGCKKDEMVLFDDAIYAVTAAKKSNLLGVVAMTDDTNIDYRQQLSETADVLLDSLSEMPQ